MASHRIATQPNTLSPSAQRVAKSGLARILVLGAPGSGKTFFTSWMTTKDLIHLDDLIQPTSRATKDVVLATLQHRPAWIAEGMEGLRLLPELLPYTDLVVFIHGGTRPGDGC